MEKKFFNAAEIEIVKLEMADIIATSCGSMDTSIDFGTPCSGEDDEE